MHTTSPDLLPRSLVSCSRSPIPPSLHHPCSISPQSSPPGRPTLMHPGRACPHVSTSVMYLCLSRRWAPSLHPCRWSTESSVCADTHTVHLSRRRHSPLRAPATLWHTDPPAWHACWAQCATPDPQHCTLFPTHNYTSPRAPQNCNTTTATNTGPQRPKHDRAGGTVRQHQDRRVNHDSPQAPTLTPTAHSAFHPEGICTPLPKCAETLGRSGMCLLTPQPHHPGKPRSYTHSWATSSIRFPFLRDPRPWH